MACWRASIASQKVDRERVDKPVCGAACDRIGGETIAVWEVAAGSEIARLKGHREALLPRREKLRVRKSKINDLVLEVVVGGGEDLSRHAKVRDQLGPDSD